MTFRESVIPNRNNQVMKELLPREKPPELLLTHHQDGVLRFSGAGGTMAFTKFTRELGRGSIVGLHPGAGPDEKAIAKGILMRGRRSTVA